MTRDRIEGIRESPVSLMPENLLKELKPQEVRDLFQYLRGDGPPMPSRCLMKAAYQKMAQDEAREAEALAWAEATLGDVADEAR